MTGLHRRGLAAALAALVCCTAAVVAGPPSTALAVPAGSRPRSLAGEGWRTTPRPGLAPTCWPIRARRPARPPRGAGTVSRSRAGRYPAACRPWCGTGPSISPRPPGRPARPRRARCSPAAQAEPPGCGRRSRCGRRPGRPCRGGTHYRLSAWLGGRARSRASVTVAFLSAAGRVLARRAIGPVGPASARGRARAPGRHRHAAARGSQRAGHAGPGDIAGQHRRPGLAVGGLRPGGRRRPAVQRLRPGPPAPAAHPARRARSPLPARIPLLFRERGFPLRSSATRGRRPTSTACCPGPVSSTSSLPRSTRATETTSPWRAEHLRDPA